MDQFLAFLQKNPFHLALFATAVITGGMLLWPLVNRMFRPGSELSPFEAVQLINRRDAIVLDIRDPGEFATGHITGARNIPLAELAGRLKELEKFKGRPIIVSCGSGARAAVASGVLRKNGFTEVAALRGGIAAWQQAGMPLEK